MELDLDSFLDSHLDSDSDSDSDDHINSVPRRTVDEILLNDDSDSSSPSSPTQNSQTLKPPNPLLLQPKLTPPLVPAQLTPDPLPRPPPPPSRPLPSLFAGVRSNAKPGAALAAATAASLSVPTPHAAAIKSRRAKVFDSGESGSTVDNDELGSNSGGDSIVEVGFEINRLEDRLVEDEENLGDLQSNPSSVGGEFSRQDGTLESSREQCGQELTTNNDAAAAAEHVFEQVDESRVSNSDEALLDTSSTSMLYSNAESRIDVEESMNFNENSSSSGLDDVRDLNAAPASAENASSDENVVSSFAGLDKDEKIDEELAIPELGTQGLEKGISYSENNEVGLGVVDGTTSSTTQVSELVEERLGQLESKRISKRAEKKSRPSLKTLELADELEKKHASTGLHWEEGAAAQPMRLEGVRRGSITLGYFDVDANNTITRTILSQAFRRDHGSPQVLAVHLNYIAVGMSKGVTVVVPSKYNAQHTENMDGKMLMLGLQGDRSHAPVTSLSFNQQGDLLLAGYGDGHVTVWDVQRVSAAKVITGEHTAPVVHALFLGQDSQVTRQFKAVTGDSKGLVLLHAFSVVPLLNRFSIKTQCLLDGQRTGTVLSASPLLFDDASGGASLSSQGNTTVSTSSIGSMMGGVVGGDAGWKLFNEGSSLVEEGVVIFVTHQTVLVVRLTPKLEVYAQLSKPVGVREGSMPYTAWKCMPPSRGSSTENTLAEAVERVSLLAIAWDRKVQVAKLVKSEVTVYGTWSLDSAAIGVSWLDDQMLVVLTLTGQLYLFAKDGTIIHQTTFAIDGSRGDDLIAYHTYFSNIFGNPEKAYHNSVAVRGASIYILGPIHLVVSRLLPWKERIEVLRKAGDWMGALNMAMSLYDGQAHGVIDLPRTLDAVQEVIMPYLVELLMAYVDEVFSYISVAFCNQIGKGEPPDDPKSRSSSVHSEIKEQFTRVGGVAVEFCVHIKRTDILFDEIFSKFVAVQQRDTFLELLEPYILKDMLGSLPPEIMQALVEHYSSKGWLQRVEQCVLHMDISSLDFNQVVRLCREHGLYGALVYLFNKGLDDYRAPLEELLVVFRSSQGENAAAPGYRMLVYLKYCFSGLAFPPGRGALPPTRLPSLKRELMQFLLENSVALNSRAVSSISFTGPYLNLHHLLELDTEATLDVLRCAFVEDQIPKPDLSLLDSPEANIEAEKENNSMAESQNHLIQDTINALIHTLENNIFGTDKSASNDDTEPVEAWPPKKDIGHLFEFIAYYVACGRANVSKNVLSQILEYLTLENTYRTSISTHNTGALKIREKQVLALLKVVPETDWSASYVLHLCENAQFYQVCGLIYTIRKQYHAALDSYIKDVDEPIHAFSFINSMLLRLSDTECAAFQSAVISRISELVELSREGAFLLVIDHFKKENLQILSELRSHPKSLFLYLKTVIEVHLSGTLNFSCLTKDYMLDVPNGILVKDHPEGLKAYFKKISDLPKFLRNNPIDVTDEMIELYLELLCQYERNSVLKFLETFESYRVEHCLRLCQEYGIIDAAAFLLERVGDVGSALLLTLSSLNDKLFELDTAVGSIIPNVDLCSSGGMEYFSTVLKLKELSDIQDILHTCIGLCQRNTPRLNPEESETLWFRVLDSFCEPLMDSSCNDKMISEGDNYVGILAESLASKEIEEESIIKYRISKSHGRAYVLRKLFSQFIKEIVQGMIGYVHLPTIMSKLLSDNGSQEFGDFKLTILGMLGTYDFERKILDTAMSLIEDDAFYTVNLLKKGASHGYAPQSVICCICSCVFTKNSSSSGIRVFNCGHATHLQCELLENEASSRGSLSGCPVCMPKKTTQKSRNKSVLQDNGLVNKFSSRSHQAQGTNVLHPYESDGFENAYGLQQISRFEMLNNLQKNSSLIQIVNMPQLKLAPPAVYHEKVKKRSGILSGESSSGLAEVEKSSKNRQLREQRVKGSSLRIPLKTSIFGRDWTSRR